MYQDRMCMSSETGKGFFFQVLHTSAYAGFYACFCLLFQLFDATRSWISMRRYCYCVVGVVAVFFSPHFMFAFAFVSSHMLWERNIHTNAQNHQTVPTDFHGDRKREERFLFETQSNQFYRCKNNIFTIAFYLNLSLFICHRLFVIHISTDRTDEREKKPDTYGFFHQINKYDPKN